jgi:catechol 2,3-dioxygenase-like lactoylglutathione lyase family enzyme
MQPIISDLVARYERGSLSRRELIQGLALLVAAGRSAAAEPGALVAQKIDHICVRVSDMERSLQFYQSLFGLQVLGEDREHRIKRLGVDKRVLVSLRQDEPHGMIDHFAIGVENFNRESVTRVLQQHGLAPKEDWEYGFHIKDPDGAVVQLM